LTDIQHGGETFGRVPVVGGGIMMGDRVYATPPGVAHVVNAGGDVLVRLNRGTLPLFDRYGRRMALLPLLRAGEPPIAQDPFSWSSLRALTGQCALILGRGDQR
jgi:hypothetical protein